MTARSLSAALVLLLALPLQAQQRTHMNLQLQGYLRAADPKGQVDLFLRGDGLALTRAVLAHGGSVRTVVKHWALARVPNDQVAALDKEAAVQAMEFSLWHGTTLNDSMRVKARVEPVHLGMAPLPEAYNGDGVIMGIIDTGIDLTHPDFQTAFGRTRVLKYWDQTFAYDADRTPMPYGYGQEWDSTAINAGQCLATDPLNQYGHGTTVAGTAAGGGMATGHYAGVAPKADIVMVGNALASPNWTSTIVDAVQYIFHVADSLGRPVSINISLGSYYGSHDGLDPATLMIKDMLDASPGRMVTCAAGNSGGLAPYHLRTDVTSDTSFTWFRYGSNLPYVGSGVYFDLWADTADFNNVHYSVGADRRTNGYAARGAIPYHTVQAAIDQVVVDTIWSPDHHKLGVVNTLATLRDGQYHFEVAMTDADSADNYFYRFSTTGAGRFDVWSTSTFNTSEIIRAVPTAAEFPPIVHYVQPDNQQSIVDGWACSPDMLTVGNYYNEQVYTDMNGNVQDLGATEGAISTNSSRGPSRTGLVKPDVAAPGDITFSPGPLLFIQQLIAGGQSYKIAPGMFHLRGGGTSIASPVVAGTAALYFEKCPRATHLQVRDAINNTAFGDALTGTLPNIQFGNGRIDAFAALVTSNFTVPITGPTSVCDGDSVMLEGPDFMYSYLWSTGSTFRDIYSHGGEASLHVENVAGCAGRSDTISITVLPLPPVPTVLLNGATITSSETAATYQWYKEGVAIVGETAQSYDVTITGNYAVRIYDVNGCSSISAPVLVTALGIAEPAASAYRVWPVPASDRLTITNGKASRPLAVEVMDLRGARVACAWQWSAGRVELDVQGLASGTYAVRIVRDGGADVLHFVKR